MTIVNGLILYFIFAFCVGWYAIATAKKEE